MRILTCDICNEVVDSERNLTELRNELSSNGIRDMCPKCRRIIDDLYLENKNKHSALADEDTKKDIIALCEKYKK